MKRRNFLGFLGGAAVAGPSAAKTAAEATVGDLSLQRMGINGSLGQYYPTPSAPRDNKQWAKDRIKTILGTSARERAMKKRQYHVELIDPNIAANRSMSLVTKVRISRDLEFERRQRSEMSYLEGVIKGWWG